MHTVEKYTWPHLIHEENVYKKEEKEKGGTYIVKNANEKCAEMSLFYAE